MVMASELESELKPRPNSKPKPKLELAAEHFVRIQTYTRRNVPYGVGLERETSKAVRWRRCFRNFSFGVALGCSLRPKPRPKPKPSENFPSLYA